MPRHPVKVIRKCLGCGKDFRSEHKFNRMCTKCLKEGLKE